MGFEYRKEMILFQEFSFSFLFYFFLCDKKAVNFIHGEA